MAVIGNTKWVLLVWNIVEWFVRRCGSKYHWFDQVCTDPWGFKSIITIGEIWRGHQIQLQRLSIKETIRFPQHCENSCSIHCRQNSRYNLVIICVCGAPGLQPVLTSSITTQMSFSACWESMLACLWFLIDQKLELITRTGWLTRTNELTSLLTFNKDRKIFHGNRKYLKKL